MSNSAPEDAIQTPTEAGPTLKTPVGIISAHEDAGTPCFEVSKITLGIIARISEISGAQRRKFSSEDLMPMLKVILPEPTEDECLLPVFEYATGWTSERKTKNARKTPARCPSILALRRVLQIPQDEEIGIYFTAATLVEGCKDRTRKNISRLGSMRLDLDVAKPGSPIGDRYADADEALQALVDAISRGLPAPTLILSSGGGIHAYWKLAEGVSVAEWEPVAKRFKTALTALGMRYDEKVTADVARVMRMPGSLNKRYGQPRLVRPLWGSTAEYTLEDFDSWLNALVGGTLPGRAAIPQELRSRLHDMSRMDDLITADQSNWSDKLTKADLTTALRTALEHAFAPYCFYDTDCQPTGIREALAGINEAIPAYVVLTAAVRNSNLPELASWWGEQSRAAQDAGHARHCNVDAVGLGLDGFGVGTIIKACQMESLGARAFDFAPWRRRADISIVKGKSIGGGMALGEDEDSAAQARTPRRLCAGDAVRHGLIHASLGNMSMSTVEWLWKDYLPLGAISMISGQPGLGKSQITLGIAAAVSTGGAWPFDGGRAPKGSVLLLSCEDSTEQTIIPRLVAAGADLNKFEHLKYSVRPDGNEGGLTLADHDKLDKWCEDLGDVRLIIIDPIMAYMGVKDAHSQADVRGALAPMVALAQRHNCAVLMVNHLNKSVGKGGSVMDRSAGSGAFTAAARAAFFAWEDEDGRRYFACAKSNLAKEPPGILYSLQSVALQDSCGLVQTSKIVWEEEIVGLRASAGGEDKEAEEEKRRERVARTDERQQVRTQLTVYLWMRGGIAPSTEIIKAMREATGATERVVREEARAICGSPKGMQVKVNGKFKMQYVMALPDDIDYEALGIPLPFSSMTLEQIVAEAQGRSVEQLELMGISILNGCADEADAVARLSTLKPKTEIEKKLKDLADEVTELASFAEGLGKVAEELGEISEED